MEISNTPWNDTHLNNTFSACLVNIRVNTFSLGRQLPKMPYDKHFHISNFYVCRCTTKQVFLKV